MTAVAPRPATAPQPYSRPPHGDRTATAAMVCPWGLSVTDWRAHALIDAAEPAWGMQRTRCGVWHPIGCPVAVARRGEVCPRCAAVGIQQLELLPDRTAAVQARPW